MLEQRALDDHAERTHHERRQHQREPVAEPELLEAQPGHVGADHVQRAVREVDDPQEAEDHRQPQAQHRVERAVHEAQQELA